MADKPETIRLPSAAYVLPILTVAGYVYAYAYEVGYANFFGYPTAFIPITAGLILGVAGALFFLLILTIPFLQINLIYWPHSKRYVLVAIFMMWLFVVVLLRWLAPAVWSYAAFFMGPLLAVFPGNWLRERERTASEKQDESYEHRQLPPQIYDARGDLFPDSVAQTLVQRLGFDPLLRIVVMLIVIPLFFVAIGNTDARLRTEHLYFTLDSGESYVVLRAFENRLIAARSSEELGQFFTEYHVRAPETAGGLLLREVGQLSPFSGYPRDDENAAESAAPSGSQ